METKFAVIKDGKIANIIVADPEWIATQDMGAVVYTEGNIGDGYDNGVITPAEPEITNYRTARRDRLFIAMHRDNGALAEVKAAVKAANGEIEIWFDTATSFSLDDQRLIDALAVLNIPEARAQKWFNEANSIE